MKIDISVIIVNYEARELVRECVKGLKRLNSALAIEIIVVDNSCDSALKELLAQRFEDVRYISSGENIGFSRANNRGMKEAHGEYILILNYDITPLPGSIDKLFSYMNAHPDVGIIGPRLKNPDGTIQDSFYRFHSLVTPLFRRTWLGKVWKGKKHIDHFLMREADTARPLDVDWLLGACLMVRASCIPKVGYMDERFFLYFEDTDWCRRFGRAGYKVRYVPDAQMVHLHRRDSAQGGFFAALLHKTTRIHIASWITYILKWRDQG